jgi:hypothetical protein
MKWIRNIFKKKISYMFFKKVTNNYYGMCGTKRLYIKTPKESGRFSYMQDMSVAHHMERNGWIEISEEEHDNATSYT